MSKLYKKFRIRLASPEEILSWSYGEVKKHETINYRTLKPEPEGLFCERIFGPMKDFQCACGKAKRNIDKGKICEKCGVEITESKVRRERMGHIKLASPVVHTWFLRNTPSKLAILLNVKTKDLEEVVYLASYIVTNPGQKTSLSYKQVLSEVEYQRYYEEFGNQFKAQTGAEAIKTLLKELDLEKEIAILRRLLKSPSKQKRDNVIKRLEVVESFYNSDNKPEWMIIDVLPVIPPDLRPMVQLDGGRFATTDLNDLYRRILNRNNRLKRQYEQNAPHLITKNEKRMLQEAVDALIDNSKRGKKAAVEKNRHLKSLSDMLRGKQGRFRQNLLGKRVDYSGRSVIVVGPDLKMHQCGIPKEMALTLFKPFVIRELIRGGLSISAAKKACERQEASVWGILEGVVQEHPVLLNRAPTLHRLGIQAFEPILIEGKAIRLHPLVTTAFNADFDGDQMAVHVPLSLEAQAEARLLMLASNNILNPKDGKPVVTPSQDMVLGNYYLTMEIKGQPNEGKFFKDYSEAYLAYKNGYITLHTRIFIDPKTLPQSKFQNNTLGNKYLFTTLGKLIFNNILPEEFPYVNEASDTNLTVATPDKYFMNPKLVRAYGHMIDSDPVPPFKKKFLARIIAEVFKQFQITETSKMLDRLKDLGFYYSTISGITISVSDVQVYKDKDILIEKAEAKVAKIRQMFEMGLLTNKERAKLVEREWAQTRDEVQSGLWKDLSKKKDNHIFMMADSGSRGSESNFAQLAGMRGLMNNTSGQVIEVPVKANFREGLTVSEFFISTHGSRKGSTDTALKTAESGYLTRRLVDVSQDVIVSSEDCQTERGFLIKDILDDGGKVVVNLVDRISGRFLARDLYDPQTKDIIARRNELVTNSICDKVVECGIKEVYIRSNLTCNAKTGVCMKCYGRNLATNKVVEVGEAVGTIAAQSIGEPGTQLTMRTFQSGGVASTTDITQGLPRVQELFEARKPKGRAIISEINGTCTKIERTSNGVLITINNDLEEKAYLVEMNSELLVDIGSTVKRGERIIKGSIEPKELLRVTDAETVQRYIVEEIQKVYCSQGVEISDKHIEIIVRQMMRKVLVIREGSTKLLPGRSGREISIKDFNQACLEVLQNGGELPVAKPVLLGITKASLSSDSFLSAASFQETTRILTDAAIKAKEDELFGLKENVIIGGLIPAGTGLLVEEHFKCEQKPAEETEPKYPNLANAYNASLPSVEDELISLGDVIIGNNDNEMLVTDVDDDFDYDEEIIEDYDDDDDDEEDIIYTEDISDDDDFE